MYGAMAKILIDSEESRRVVASAARISTSEGTALSVYDRSGDAAKDVRLIKKVLSSGHKSILEHHSFSIAFDNVSVLAEQFMIEHRLAAYTVKSRRYVDHSGAGYVIPEGLEGAALDKYRAAMDSLFALYADLTAAGVPREDARFVLPYSFRSNFYMSVNGRELVRLISELTTGRGSGIPELKLLGNQLKDQLEAYYPGLSESEESGRSCAMPAPVTTAKSGIDVTGQPILCGMTPDPVATLNEALAFSHRFPCENGINVSQDNMKALVRDARPRELEFINARFIVKNVSLACITHFTRHRIQSLLVPDPAEALKNGDYVLPQTVIEAGLEERYRAAFDAQARVSSELLTSGFAPACAGYLALAGHVTDIMFDMNGRELLHFLKLRTCTRAQWEIRTVAREMLNMLREKCPEVFAAYGPSCTVEGRCPEGRLSCGNPQFK